MPGQYRGVPTFEMTDRLIGTMNWARLATDALKYGVYELAIVAEMYQLVLQGVDDYNTPVLNNYMAQLYNMHAQDVSKICETFEIVFAAFESRWGKGLRVDELVCRTVMQSLYFLAEQYNHLDLYDFLRQKTLFLRENRRKISGRGWAPAGWQFRAADMDAVLQWVDSAINAVLAPQTLPVSHMGAEAAQASLLPQVRGGVWCRQHNPYSMTHPTLFFIRKKSVLPEVSARPEEDGVIARM